MMTLAIRAIISLSAYASEPIAPPISAAQAVGVRVIIAQNNSREGFMRCTRVCSDRDRWRTVKMMLRLKMTPRDTAALSRRHITPAIFSRQAAGGHCPVGRVFGYSKRARRHHARASKRGRRDDIVERPGRRAEGMNRTIFLMRIELRFTAGFAGRHRRVLD